MDLFTAKLVWIATSVPSLMMLCGDRGGVCRQAHAQDHLLSDGRMLFHDQPLFIVKLAWLLEDVIRNSNLSHIVKAGAALECDHLVGLKSHLAAQSDAVCRHPFGVAVGLSVSG